MEQRYKGVPLSDLRIEDIEWTEQAVQHIVERRERTGHLSDEPLEPDWATEAALDDDRLVVPSEGRTSPDNASLAVIGHSPSAPPDGRVLKVYIWSDDPEFGSWNGATAHIASRKDRRLYESKRGGSNG